MQYFGLVLIIASWIGCFYLTGQLEAYQKAAQDIKPDWTLNLGSSAQGLIGSIRTRLAVA